MRINSSSGIVSQISPGRRIAGALLLALAVLSPSMAHAAVGPDGRDLWQDVVEQEIALRGERWIAPASYRTLSLNYPGVQAHLSRAPMEGQLRVGESPLVLALPRSDGTMAEFAVLESPVMEAELAAKFPGIRSYVGQGIDDPTATLRLDVGPLGLHAQVLSARGDYYIDPYQLRDTGYYMAYRRIDMGDNVKGYRCQVEGHDHAEDFGLDLRVEPDNPSGATLRTYRTAIAATPTYTNHFGGTVADGIAGLTTLVNRLSGVYEREFSVRLMLVGNNDQIVYTNANPGPLPDPPNSPSSQIQTTINNAIGFANYDLGHAVGGGGGGGAITPLGNVCGTSKARGFTALNPPRGDVFDIDFVAHELGHQLGGSHTWNGCGGGSQWTSTSAMEPGSGSTIMGYAGICSDNLMPNSDAYFHARSFTQIFQIINNGGSGNGNTVCGTVTATGNQPPNVTTTANMSIPEQTPFQLTAIASDPDAGDELTYNWEQVDTGAQGSPSTTGDNGTAPLFRSFHASSSPTRIFPSLRYILNNANVPPTTISLPPAGGSFRPGEILPNPSSGTRVMNFRLTARDNRAGGGGLRHSPNVQVTAVAAAGPFTVGNITGPLGQGSSQAITWTVANTDLAPISTSMVNILISLDDGYTFTTLLANTPNDGSQTVTLPATGAARARIKVEAANGTGIGAGSTYFDITDTSFAITDAGSALTVTAATAPADLIATKQGSPAPSPKNIAVIAGGNMPYTATADSYPPTPEVTIENLSVSGTTVSASAFASCQAAAPNAPSFRTYPAVLTITDAAGRKASTVFPVNVSNNELPTLGAYADVSIEAGNSGMAIPAAAPLDPNGNLLSVTVTPSSLPGGGSITVDAPSGEVSVLTSSSTLLGSYPVRVEVLDTCGALAARTFNVSVTDTLFENGFE